MKARELVVVVLIVIGFSSSSCLASSIAGAWSTWLEFDKTLDLTSFESTFDIGYSIYDWTLGGSIVFDDRGIEFVFARASGELGIVDFYTETVYTRFDSPRWFDGLILSARASFEGIEGYSIFLFGENAHATGLGNAFLAGCAASLGDATIWGQAQFNAMSTLTFLRRFGYEQVLDLLFYVRTCRGVWGHIPMLRPLDVSCDLPWSGADLVVETPLSCFSLTASLHMTCDAGFDAFEVEIEDVELGFEWLSIGEIECAFETEGKTLHASFALEFLDHGCVTPYVSLESADASISGLSLRALVASYEVGGATIKIGERFGDSSWSTWQENMGEAMSVYAFGETGDVIGYGDVFVPSSCVYSGDYEEYLGVEIAGEACCSAPFHAWVYSWFDLDGTDAMFDWAETVAFVECAVGSHSGFFGKVSYVDTGLNWFRVGVTAAW